MVVKLLKSLRGKGVTVTLSIIKETDKAKQLQYIVEAGDGVQKFKSVSVWIPKTAIKSENEQYLVLDDWVLEDKKEFFNDLPKTLYIVEKEVKEKVEAEPIMEEKKGFNAFEKFTLICDACGRAIYFPKFVVVEFIEPYKTKPFYFCSQPCMIKYFGGG